MSVAPANAANANVQIGKHVDLLNNTISNKVTIMNVMELNFRNYNSSMNNNHCKNLAVICVINT